MFVLHFLLDKVLLFQTDFPFISETKEVVTGHIRQVIVLYNNNCLEFAWEDSALVILNKWLSYRGGRLNRLDCNALR